MPTPKDRARALVVSRLFLALNRETNSHFLDGGILGASSDDLIICLALFVGQSESRPFTAGKLATYVGIPRATVTRRLSALRENRVVRQDDAGWWSVALDRDAVFNALCAINVATAQHIKNAAKKLSILDTSPIA